MSHEPMQIGKKATVRVSMVMQYTVEVEMPVDGDPGEQADFELFALDRFDDYDEKDIVHSEILEEEPLYEDERDKEEWPTYV